MWPSTADTTGGRFLLNEVLGTKGQVQILRVLATKSDGTLASSEAAERTGMTESGVRKALKRLADAGIVERVGKGRSTRYVLDREAGLPRRIAGLFELEKRSSSAVVHGLRSVLRTALSGSAVVWIRHLGTQREEPLTVAVLSETERPEALAERLAECLAPVEREFGIRVEVEPCTREDLAREDWASVVPLVGSPGSAVSRTREAGSRTAHEVDGNGTFHPKSPEFANALVALIDQDLSLLKRARDHVAAQLRDRDPGNGHDLWEWRKILDTYPLPRLLHFLESDSPRAVRLRQSSPFPEVLSGLERQRLRELAHRPN